MKRVGALPAAVVLVTLALVLWWVQQPLTVEADLVHDQPPDLFIGPPPEPEGDIQVVTTTVLCDGDVQGPAPDGSRFSNGSSWEPKASAFHEACEPARARRRLVGAAVMAITLLGAGLLLARLRSWDRDTTGVDALAAAEEPMIR